MAALTPIDSAPRSALLRAPADPGLAIAVLSTGMLRCLAVSVLVAAACSKGSTAQQTSPSNKAEPPPLAAASTDVLAYLPVGSELVVGMDANAMRASALWKQFEPQIVAALGNKLPMMRDKCGFDPLRSVESVTMAGKLGMNEQFDGVIVVRGVSGAKTLECIALATEGEGIAKNERGVLTVDRGGTDKMVATIVGASTLVVQAGPAASAATLDSVVRSGVPLRSSKGFMELFDRREANASVWGMVNGNSQLLKMAAQAGAQPKSMDGTLVLHDRFVGAMRVTFANQADADLMKKQVSGVLPMVQGKVDKIDLTTNGAMLRLDVVATDAQVRSLMAMLGF